MRRLNKKIMHIQTIAKMNKNSDISNNNLRHGQALAMQWVGLVLQKIVKDISSGGNITKQLIGDAKSVNSKNDLNTIALGCHYVVAFILPLTIELALKALLSKQGIKPKNSHNLSDLHEQVPEQMKRTLQDTFFHQKKEVLNQENGSLEQLLARHSKDFVDWRYLDQPERLEKSDTEMQIAICTILDVYNL
jgi:hypothetical protein